VAAAASHDIPISWLISPQAITLPTGAKVRQISSVRITAGGRETVPIKSGGLPLIAPLDQGVFTLRCRGVI
jgi:hypothetical protein